MRLKTTLFCICFLVSNVVVSQTRSQDSSTLKALYNNTDGPNWNNNENWNSGSLNQWFGISLKNRLWFGPYYKTGSQFGLVLGGKLNEFLQFSYAVECLSKYALDFRAVVMSYPLDSI
ncbi:hypothetical protein OAD66_04620 [Bacteroidia bacterium]|nr:hypothetical protein [Bacteroidia bacterium]MDB4107283.1 hypothetical protein [Bacteroidia bacterium]MDB9882401.1 hypothetical protein [Bacteroidia bacterium]